MAIKFYNTIQQRIIHTPYMNYYVATGTRPNLPEGTVELVVVDVPPPQYDAATQKLSSIWQVDLQTNEYRRIWTVTNKTQSEIAMQNWKHSQYLKRIIAPKGLLFDDIGIQMYGWFQLNNLPVELIDNNIYLWCNEILPEHQAIVDNLQGVIVIQDRPVEI